MLNKTILVTGGSGFLGSALAQRLVKEDFKVKVLDNQSRGSVYRLKGVLDKIEFIEGDIRDASLVARACANVDTVFHLAYVNGTELFYSKPGLVLDVGIRGMLNVLDACILHNVPELILASSSEVYHNPVKIPTDEQAPLIVPDPLNPRFSYSGGKIASELLAINLGRNNFKRVVIFRPHNVYGPDMGWEHVIPQITLRLHKLDANSKKVPFTIEGTGKETRSFCYIDDCIEGIMTLYRKGKHLEIYNIGSSTETSIADLVKEIADILNKQITIKPGKVKSGSPTRRCPDITKLKHLGYLPKVSLKEGLPIVVAWYDKHANER